MVDCASMKALPKRKGNAQARGVTAPVENRLNESPSEKEGKYSTNLRHDLDIASLNESPSEKEGKFCQIGAESTSPLIASMKALPKRKGNPKTPAQKCASKSLNESPSEKEGKSPQSVARCAFLLGSLNESPSEKEGKSQALFLPPRRLSGLNESPSEKEGKSPTESRACGNPQRLNESPSEKEGKSPATTSPRPRAWAPQ